ncbi:SDR family NAD(P)-dependent oxidoreductase [Amphritea sp. 1_MG-2023]|uniref:SDR family NAD(P)-dependent oxidoreductase n=1 Tax=Amphritea sp. 1_MG-2023 TaxID=3062670 RepID=UPI0026E208F7|nr:SDR family NAD(P)-dependent oxidoreductase [Amphritea sp. 1_MG-2023]MDO6563336.1 SDR family NAD(P)-dependent oxidoreductase [Amphritea sp. 1_MG-2023]
MKNDVLPWKNVWITGAGRGIGAALTRLLCDDGVTVYGSARTLEQLTQLQQALASSPGKLIPVPLDIRDHDAVEQQFQVWDQQGFMPDLVVLNAGSHDAFPATEFSAARCKALLDINLQGTLNCLEPVLYRYLHVGQQGESDTAEQLTGLHKGRGQVAVVASVAGYRGLPTAAAYGAGKAALINLCESLRLELQGKGVKLQLINPGFVRTPLTDKNDFPMPALMEADEAAQRIVKGLLSQRFEIVFPRRFVYLLKLFRVLPYNLYFWLIKRITGSTT